MCSAELNHAHSAPPDAESGDYWLLADDRVAAWARVTRINQNFEEIERIPVHDIHRANALIIDAYPGVLRAETNSWFRMIMPIQSAWQSDSAPDARIFACDYGAHVPWADLADCAPLRSASTHELICMFSWAVHTNLDQATWQHATASHIRSTVRGAGYPEWAAGVEYIVTQVRVN